MSIEDLNTVDAIGLGGETDDVVLLISDHLEWNEINQDDHMYKLQEKINTYLRFYESGELYENQPDAKGKTVIIDIVTKYDLNEKGQWFFDQLKPIVESAGLLVRYRKLEE